MTCCQKNHGNSSIFITIQASSSFIQPQNTLAHSSLEHPIVAHEITDVTTQIIFVLLHKKRCNLWVIIRCCWYIVFNYASEHSVFVFLFKTCTYPLKTNLFLCFSIHVPRIFTPTISNNKPSKNFTERKLTEKNAPNEGGGRGLFENGTGEMCQGQGGVRRGRGMDGGMMGSLLVSFNDFLWY